MKDSKYCISCSTDDSPKPATIKGMCETCYQRAYQREYCKRPIVRQRRAEAQRRRRAAKRKREDATIPYDIPHALNTPSTAMGALGAMPMTVIPTPRRPLTSPVVCFSPLRALADLNESSSSYAPVFTSMNNTNDTKNLIINNNNNNNNNNTTTPTSALICNDSNIVPTSALSPALSAISSPTHMISRSRSTSPSAVHSASCSPVADSPHPECERREQPSIDLAQLVAAATLTDELSHSDCSDHDSEHEHEHEHEHEDDHMAVQKIQSISTAPLAPTAALRLDNLLPQYPVALELEYRKRTRAFEEQLHQTQAALRLATQQFQQLQSDINQARDERRSLSMMVQSLQHHKHSLEREIGDLYKRLNFLPHFVQPNDMAIHAR